MILKCRNIVNQLNKEHHSPYQVKNQMIPGDKFKQSSFHKEGKSVSLRTDVPAKPKPQSHIQTLMKKHAQSEFVQELAETGRANWKKAPKELKTRYYGIYMVMFSIPLIFISSWEMYRRLEGKSTKKVQEGEMLEGQSVRKYDEVEKWSTEKNSLMYKLFGRDFFLDGFTSKTMKRDVEEKSEK